VIELADVVRAALAEPSATIISSQVEPRQGGRRVHVLSGTARVGSASRPWRVVRKLVDAANEVEARLYASGVLDDLPVGIRAPRCYGWDDGWLWLEHLEEDEPRHWSTQHWTHAARQLGQLNGAYLAGLPLPAKAMLSPRLRELLDRQAPLVERIAAAPDDPRVRHWWPRVTVDAILSLWHQRESFCAALERMPQTFCHGDAIRRNLLFRGNQLFAVDWEQAGLYAPGEEVGQMLSIAAAFFDTEPADLPALDEAIFAAYSEGLGPCDTRQLRFAYAAHAALRNLFNAVGTAVPSDEGAAAAVSNYGHTWDALAERRAMIRPFLLARADEARALMEAL